MSRTKGSKNNPQNTLKKGIPKTPVLSYVDGKNIIAEIQSGAYKIYVTDSAAVVKSTYFSIIYENPSLQYQSYLYLATLKTKPDRTEEDNSILESLSILYPDFAGFHLLYFTDTTLARDMYDYHFKYLNNKLEAMELEELKTDSHDALDDVKEQIALQNDLLKTEDLQN